MAQLQGFVALERRLREEFRLPSSISCRAPSSVERQSLVCLHANEMMFYVEHFACGLTLPLSPFVRSVFHFLGVCPSQADPNFIRIMRSFEEMNEAQDTDFGWHEFLHLYRCSGHVSGEEGPLIVYLEARKAKESLSLTTTHYPHCWREDLVVIGGFWEGSEDEEIVHPVPRDLRNNSKLSLIIIFL